MNFKPTRHSLTVDGEKRKYIKVSPSPEKATGDLFFFVHGSTQSANVGRRFTDQTFDQFAERGCTVIYPDGVHHHWNDSRVTLPEVTRELGTDDVAFFDAIINAEREESCKHGRIFLVGYSNGGQMVLRLLHELDHEIHGAAAIAATQPAPDNFLSDPAGFTPTPVLFMHGTLDKLAPFEGGSAGPRAEKARGEVLGFHDTLKHYAALNGAEFANRTLIAKNETQTIKAINYTGTHPVRGIEMEGVGHVIPTHSTVDSPHIGPATTLIVAADVIGDFFFTDDAGEQTR